MITKSCPHYVHDGDVYINLMKLTACIYHTMIGLYEFLCSQIVSLTVHHPSSRSCRRQIPGENGVTDGVVHHAIWPLLLRLLAASSGLVDLPRCSYQPRCSSGRKPTYDSSFNLTEDLVDGQAQPITHLSLLELQELYVQGDGTRVIKVDNKNNQKITKAEEVWRLDPYRTISDYRLARLVFDYVASQQQASEGARG